MKLASIILGLVASVAGVAAPSGTPEPHVFTAPLSESPLPMGEMFWIGSPVKGGPEVKYWGTSLDHIEAQVQKHHPGGSIFDKTLPRNHTAALVPKSIEKRSASCTDRFGVVSPGDVLTGINQLYQVTGFCGSRARQCIRTQCVGDVQGDAGYGAAIALCNDNYYDLIIGCNQVAEMARSIHNDCVWPTWCWQMVEGIYSMYVCGAQNGGQIFDAGSFNVIVGYCRGFSPDGQSVKN